MTDPGLPAVPLIPMDAPATTPAPRRRRPVLIAAVVTAVVLLGAAAYAVYPREDSGTAACRRIAEIAVDGGTEPTITEAETRKLTNQLRGSSNAALKNLGDAYQIGVDKADAGDPQARHLMEGTSAVFSLILSLSRPCGKLGIEIPVPRPPRPQPQTT